MAFKSFSSFSRPCPQTKDWHSELSKIGIGNSFYTSITPTSFKAPEEKCTLNVMPRREDVKVGLVWGYGYFLAEIFHLTQEYILSYDPHGTSCVCCQWAQSHQPVMLFLVTY